jgi:NADH-ubiquinone oxidoreductase chain 6
MTSLVLDLLAVSTVLAAVLVITARSPIVAVLYLIGVFVLAACYLVCLGITYVGLTYLVVYVGAVAVLFLFVVMMLNIRLSEVVSTGYEYTKGLPLGLMLAVVFLLEALSIVPSLSSAGMTMALGALSGLNATLLGTYSSPVVATSDVHLVFSDQAADASFAYLSQVQALGLSLYTYGFLWLMLISFVLLLAMLGPIALCLRSRQYTA